MKILNILVAIFLASPAFSAQLDLPKDVNGWTVFTPSADSRIVYVSATGNDLNCVSYLPNNALIGSDPFNPVGAVLPCATYTKARSLTRNGYPDWILMKRGDTFFTGIGNVGNGRSITEPSLIGSYGATGSSPLLKTGATAGISITNEIKYFALSGIDFYAHTRDPDSPDYVDAAGVDGLFIYISPSIGTGSVGILVEGCKFRYYKNNTNIAGAYGRTSSYTLRRNLFDYSYNTTNHSQGIVISYIDDFIIEENIFNHNGWLIQSYNSTDAEGQATFFNHNLYATDISNLSVKNNVFMMASSNNTKIKFIEEGGGVNLLVDNNLYIGGEIAISIGAPDQHANFSTVNPVITNNVYLHAGLGNPTNREVAWFFYNFNWDGGTVSNNLMLHQTDASLVNGQFFHIGFSGRNIKVHDNIVYDVKNTVPIYLIATEGVNPARSGITFSNNNFDTQGAYIVDANAIASITGYSFANNKYSSSKTSDTWFRVNGATLNDSQWVTTSGDTSVNAMATYPDPTRDITSYMKTLGKTSTIDAFITAARAQDRYNWDMAYTAPAVNAWIKLGFYTPTYLRIKADGKFLRAEQ